MKVSDDSHRRVDGPDRFGTRNALKLGVFGVNVSGGCAMTSAPGTLEVTWPETLRIAAAADAAGFEAIIPVSRWRGIEGDVHFNHRSFETYAWAAGVAQATQRVRVFCTSLISVVHPMFAAKQAATIDHISGGRLGLNVVAGWNPTETAMFGLTQRPHDERYAYAEEWMTLAKELWSRDGSFDFEGRYFRSEGLYLEPKPIQAPYPLVMSAGLSPAGRTFAAKHADLLFVTFPTLAPARAAIADIRRYAREEFGREISIFGMGYVYCAETEAEARDYFRYCVHEKGDWRGVENLISLASGNSASVPKEEFAKRGENLIAGYGALPLIGTPDQVVDGMRAMHDAGMDGIALSWVNYEQGISQFRDRLDPLLVQAGLRTAA